VSAGGRDNDVTALLVRWRAGSPEAEEALMAKVGGELRRLAAGYLRRERPGHTLQPTALVNEAYLRLIPQRDLDWENRTHFFGVAATMMRRVLVDHARRKRAQKREHDADQSASVSVMPAVAGGADVVDVIDLDDALVALAAVDPRQVEIVEKRYFCGLTVEEVAEAMHVSPATIKREWATAKLFLRQYLRGR
jgi:RNA polymerase sigma factor (TIGR02999 family)